MGRPSSLAQAANAMHHPSQAANFKLVPLEYQLLVVNLFTILGGCCCCPCSSFRGSCFGSASLHLCTCRATLDAQAAPCPQTLLCMQTLHCRCIFHELGTRERWLVPTLLPWPGCTAGHAGACDGQQQGGGQWQLAQL